MSHATIEGAFRICDLAPTWVEVSDGGWAFWNDND